MKFLIFLGSIRESTPPKPARLGVRVGRACSEIFGNEYSEHSVEIIDPLDYDFGAVFKPHFAYPKNRVPEQLDELARKIASADGYIMVSPEYNHSMSPALAHMLNHFGSSLYSYKPSVIVTYSAGQWGGMRAAVGMRTFLSELGCLPVSAMIHVPSAQDVFDEGGTLQKGEDRDRWTGYFGRAFAQLAWWAEATRNHRKESDPEKLATPFKRDPSQRNAP